MSILSLILTSARFLGMIEQYPTGEEVKALSDAEVLSALWNALSWGSESREYEEEASLRIRSCADLPGTVWEWPSDSICRLMVNSYNLDDVMVRPGLGCLSVLRLVAEAMLAHDSMKSRILSWFTDLEPKWFEYYLSKLHIEPSTAHSLRVSRYLLDVLMKATLERNKFLYAWRSIGASLLCELIGSNHDEVPWLEFFAPGIGSSSVDPDGGSNERRALLMLISGLVFRIPKGSSEIQDPLVLQAYESLWKELEIWMNGMNSDPIIQLRDRLDIMIMEPVVTNYVALAETERKCEHLSLLNTFILEYIQIVDKGWSIWKKFGFPWLQGQCSFKYEVDMVAHRDRIMRENPLTAECLVGVAPIGIPDLSDLKSLIELGGSEQALVLITQWVTREFQGLLGEVLVFSDTENAYMLQKGLAPGKYWMLGLAMGLTERFDIFVPVMIDWEVSLILMGVSCVADSDPVSPDLLPVAEAGVMVRKGIDAVFPLKAFARFQFYREWLPAHTRDVLPMYGADTLLSLLRDVRVHQVFRDASAYEIRLRIYNGDGSLWAGLLLANPLETVQMLLSNEGTQLASVLIQWECHNNPSRVSTLLEAWLSYVVGHDPGEYPIREAALVVKFVSAFATECDASSKELAVLRLMGSMVYLPSMILIQYEENMDQYLIHRALFVDCTMYLLDSPRLSGAGFRGLLHFWDLVEFHARDVSEQRRHFKEVYAMEPAVISYIALFPMLRDAESLVHYCAHVDSWSTQITFYRRARSRRFWMILPAASNFWTNHAQRIIDANCQSVRSTPAYQSLVSQPPPLFRESVPRGHSHFLDREHLLQSILVGGGNVPDSIQFKNEAGVDRGGLWRELFSLAVADIIQLGLFELMPGSQNTYRVGSSTSDTYMRIAGTIVGQAFVEGQPLGIAFTELVYNRLLGQEMNSLEGSRYEDPVMCANLEWILEGDETTEGYADILKDMTFSISIEAEPNAPPETVDLVPNGSSIRVTHENKSQYVEAVCDFKVKKILSTLAPFEEGFHSIVPQPDSMSAEDMRSRLLGPDGIDLRDLIAHMDFQGAYSQSSDQIVWLLEELGSYSDDQLRKFVSFVTGSELPLLGGFKNLRRNDGSISRITVMDGTLRGENGAPRLPTSATCFFTLRLPRYATRGELASKLMTAIYHGYTGFGLA